MSGNNFLFSENIHRIEKSIHHYFMYKEDHISINQLISFDLYFFRENGDILGMYFKNK